MSALSLTLATGGAHAAAHADWNAFMKANRYKCPGLFDTTNTPRTLTLGGKTYSHTGYKLEVKTGDADTRVNIGVVSAIKDVSAGTKANLQDAMAWFKSHGVEWVVVNGDLALEEFDLEEVFDMLGDAGLPVIIVPGNSESRGSWARAYADRVDRYPNLVNGMWVRQIVGDDVEFWTLPGYHDKKFVRQGAGCDYKAEDIEAMLSTLKPAGASPVVLVSHGPPLGMGAQALDYIVDKKNVGDPQINKILDKAQVPFGIFGHILEAGGRAVGKDHKTLLPEKKPVEALYLNAGSLSGDPWGMLDGSTAYGLAILMTVDGKTASYEVKKFSSR